MSDLDKDRTIFVGKGSKPEVLTLAFANRHGDSVAQDKRHDAKHEYGNDLDRTQDRAGILVGMNGSSAGFHHNGRAIKEPTHIQTHGSGGNQTEV